MPMRKSVIMSLILVSLGVTFLFALLLISCNKIFTEAPEPHTTLEEPFDGLSASELAAFLRGDEAFSTAFTVETGLGPLFNNTACVSCHPGDGRAHPNAAFKFFGKVTGTSIDLLTDLGGPQLQDKSIPGVPPEELPAEANAVSERAAPPVFGVGLIEFIPVQDILANEDQTDLDGDGISGRAHWVTSADFVPAHEVGGGPASQLGRFGLRANTSSLLEQVVRAYHQDIGITTDFLPLENYPPHLKAPADVVPDPELSAAVVQDVVFYLRTLAPPKRGKITAEVLQGEKLFTEIGCAKCHIPKLKTGASPFPVLAYRDAELYSDLLLHDMGPVLADNFIDGEAAGYEWKTKPLWGIGRAADALGGIPYYLHDARTSDLSEAILLHGGEAQARRDSFSALSEAERKAILAFLMSL